MELNYCGLRIADFGIKNRKSNIVCSLISDFRPPTSQSFGFQCLMPRTYCIVSDRSSQYERPIFTDSNGAPEKSVVAG